MRGALNTTELLLRSQATLPRLSTALGYTGSAMHSPCSRGFEQALRLAHAELGGLVRDAEARLRPLPCSSRSRALPTCEWDTRLAD
jgi:hypothetical protein